jgi:hypothetical protein
MLRIYLKRKMVKEVPGWPVGKAVNPDDRGHFVCEVPIPDGEKVVEIRQKAGPWLRRVDIITKPK